MNAFFPNRAEASFLRFLVPMPGLPLRFAVAGALFYLGFRYYPYFGFLAAVSILAGHLALWVRRTTTAPGGATPKHEDTWAPVEDTWLERVIDYERRGALWDTTPWDISNRTGLKFLAALLAACAGVPFLVSAILGSPTLGKLSEALGILIVPLWFNGMRMIWHPSELRKKGDALAIAREAVQDSAKDHFEFVPMLALRRGTRGNYPVDARLMLRPVREDAPGFLGIQFQVSINNAGGTNYPYFYAVILGQGDCSLPEIKGCKWVQSARTVYEHGEKEGVRFLVIRQHADKGGGWHTDPEKIRVLAGEAMRLGLEVSAGTNGGASK